ncbi:MAG: class I SAM-dependent methyltransferase [Candidatus Dormibacteraeota bacterium]|nr:class I SAM-dependent methyltransferase [Candidatus Dormibacteraeota bacterium]
MRDVVRDDPAAPDPGFAELYAALPEATDLEPWLSFCRPPGTRTLYLGIGAGRLAVPLARAGVPLVGVDSHPGMLAHLRRRAPGIETHLARIETLRLEERFRRVIAPSNILSTRPRLRAAARHLAPRGRLAFELLNPHWLDAGPHPGVRVTDRRPGEVDLELDYETGHTQVATVPLLWPEDIERYCAAAGLDLSRLGATDGALGLDEASSFWVVAERRRDEGTSLDEPASSRRR